MRLQMNLDTRVWLSALALSLLSAASVASNGPTRAERKEVLDVFFASASQPIAADEKVPPSTFTGDADLLNGHAWWQVSLLCRAHYKLVAADRANPSVETRYAPTNTITAEEAEKNANGLGLLALSVIQKDRGLSSAEEAAPVLSSTKGWQQDLALHAMLALDPIGNTDVPCASMLQTYQKLHPFKLEDLRTQPSERK